MKYIGFILPLYLSFTNCVQAQSTAGTYTVVEERFESSTGLWLGTSDNEIVKIDNGSLYFETITSKDRVIWIDGKLDFDKDNYELSIKVKYISGTDNLGGGVFFGGNSAFDCTEFVTSGNGWFNIREFVDKKENSIKPWTQSSLIRKYDFNTLKVKKVGDLITYFINGTEVFKGSSQHSSGSNIGVRVPGNSRFYFDDFVVKRTPRLPEESIVLKEYFDIKTGFYLGRSDENESKIERGEYTFQVFSNNYRTATQTVNIDVNRDFEISCKVKFVSGKDNEAYGILWGRNIETGREFNFYVSGNGQYVVGEVVDKYIQRKAWTESSAVDKKNFNLLQVKKQGGLYTFFINGLNVFSMPFSPFYGNRVGIGVPNNTIARFDNFMVYYTDINASPSSQTVQTNPFSVIPRPKLPPQIELHDVAYSDADKNNRLDAQETAQIKFSMTNRGKGEAYNLMITATEKTGLKGITVSGSQKIDVLRPGDSRDITIKLTAAKTIASAKAMLTINVAEHNGFDSDPVQVEFNTQQFLEPNVIVAAHQFSSESGGQSRLGIPLNLRFIVQNVGQGTANGVVCQVVLPDNIFPQDDSRFETGTLKAGESKEYNFGFFGNKKYASTTIPVSVNLSERDGFAQSKTLSLPLDAQLMATNKVEIKGQEVKQVDIKIASLLSDVDDNIPETNTQRPNAYALIIGNEDYSSFQLGLSKEVNVDYALNDAQVFKDYCIKTFGIPEKQIKLLTNATTGQMNQGLAWLNNLAKVDNGKAELFFYYSGHGLPAESTSEPYLIPVDVSGSNVTEGVALSNVYYKLTENASQRVTVILDACFSGGARNRALVAQKGVKVKPRDTEPDGNMLVITSSSGEESSGVFREKKHGYLTYYLLKKLQESRGDVNYGQLTEFVIQSVKKETALTGKPQTPQVKASTHVQSVWPQWRLNR